MDAVSTNSNNMNAAIQALRIRAKFQSKAAFAVSAERNDVVEGELTGSTMTTDKDKANPGDLKNKNESAAAKDGQKAVVSWVPHNSQEKLSKAQRDTLRSEMTHFRAAGRPRFHFFGDADRKRMADFFMSYETSDRVQLKADVEDELKEYFMHDGIWELKDSGNYNRVKLNENDADKYLTDLIDWFFTRVKELKNPVPAPSQQTINMPASSSPVDSTAMDTSTDAGGHSRGKSALLPDKLLWSALPEEVKSYKALEDAFWKKREDAEKDAAKTKAVKS